MIVNNLTRCLTTAKLVVRSLDTDTISRAINIHSSAGGFVVAILGLCTGFLWTTQGSCTLETKRGKFIGIFWSLVNLGNAVGASVVAGRTWKSTIGARALVAHDCVFIRVYRPTLLIMDIRALVFLTILLFAY